MPTYEYVCRACGHEFEEFQSIKADPIAVCPKCRKRKVERKIGIGGAVIFKGGGFYETDYRSDNYEKGAKAEQDAAKAADAPSAATEGAKPSETKAGKAPATPKASGDAPKSSAADGGAAAENRRIEARATHPSRIGRGIGNVVARNGGQAKGSSGGAKAAKPAAPAAKKAPPKSSSRKRG
ncbi:MAG: hypothetical protein RIS86_3 [Planctomycetota bacterium]|jgi:putative FmdB family regulatory protein